MAITPEQIKNQEFPMRLKGYDPDAVRVFLNDVSRAYRSTIRDQGAQWALANISDDLAAVLRAAHDAADRVVAQAEAEATEIEARADAQARAILVDANAYGSKTRTSADDEMSRALEVLHRAQREGADVARDAEAAQALLADAQQQAASIVATAESDAAERRREATEHRESARLLLERTESQAAELIRTAEADARRRVQAILTEGQGRLDQLELEERQLEERICAAQSEFQEVVYRLMGSSTTIDLTEDEPLVMIEGRLHSADPLDLFAEELHTDRLSRLPGDGATRVDRRTVQRMVSAAVDRAVEHSRA